MPYNHTAIEKKWQAYWLANRSFAALEPADAGTMPKAYVLDMFPYPSGAGLHVGHPEGYTATDIVSRYLRAKGFNVLHPMGWDAFGLPAEQYAIQTGTHPGVTTQKNIETFRRQIKALGFSYDWSREVDTTDPDYYKWTQWIFLKIHDTWYDTDFEWTDPQGRPRKGKCRPIAELPRRSEAPARHGVILEERTRELGARLNRLHVRQPGDLERDAGRRWAATAAAYTRFSLRWRRISANRPSRLPPFLRRGSTKSQGATKYRQGHGNAATGRPHCCRPRL